MELFDVEVDSIRSFEVSDQRSIDKLNSIVILPCSDILIERKRFQLAAQHAYELLQAQLQKMSDRKSKEKLLENIGYDIERLKQEENFPGIYKYISLLYPERQSLFDYVPQDTVLWIDEPLRLLETVKQLEKDEAEWMTHSLEEGKSLPAFFSVSKSYESMLFRKPFQTLYSSLFFKAGAANPTPEHCQFHVPGDAKLPWADESVEIGDGTLEEDRKPGHYPRQRA